MPRDNVGPSKGFPLHKMSVRAPSQFTEHGQKAKAEGFLQRAINRNEDQSLMNRKGSIKPLRKKKREE